MSNKYKLGDIVAIGTSSVAMIIEDDTAGDYKVWEILGESFYANTNIYNEARSSSTYSYVCNIEDILRQIKKIRGD